MSKRKDLYSSTIKLGPAIGDWTTISIDPNDLEEAKIGKVKDPNFNSLPNLEMKKLHISHYDLAQTWTKILSELLSAQTELYTISANQTPINDFYHALDKRLVMIDLSLHTLGKLKLSFTQEFMFMALNRICGGKTIPLKPKKNISDIDESLIKLLVHQLLPSFSDTWNAVIKPEHIEITLGHTVEPSKENYSSKESMISFSFDFTFGNNPQLFNWTLSYPNQFLRKLIDAKNKTRKPIHKYVYLSEETKKSTMVPIIAEIGETQLLMHELKSLQVGDIITLNKKINDPLKIKVGEKVTLEAQPGQTNHHKSIQLLHQNFPKPPDQIIQHTKKPAPFTVVPIPLTSMTSTKPNTLKHQVPHSEEVPTEIDDPQPVKTPSNQTPPATTERPEATIETESSLEPSTTDEYNHSEQGELNLTPNEPVLMEEHEASSLDDMGPDSLEPDLSSPNEELDFNSLDDSDIEEAAKQLDQSPESSPSNSFDEDDFSWDDLET